jgi:hypothetical protein
MGGENWFCPVLRTYVDQDSVTHQTEVGGMSERQRDRVISSAKSYLNALEEGSKASEHRMAEMQDTILDMPEDTIPEMRRKAVAGMTFFGMKSDTIAMLLSINIRTFRRMFRGK